MRRDRVSADPLGLLDVREVARLLGRHPRTVLRMYHDGRLSYVMVGRQYMTTRWRLVRDLGIEEDGGHEGDAEAHGDAEEAGAEAAGGDALAPRG